MIKIISKKLLAIRSNPLINDTIFDQVQEQLNGIHPRDSKKKKEDSGQNRMTFIDDWLGLGTNDRPPNAGTGMGAGRNPYSTNEQLSSGYNDGGQADDETGPGNSSIATDPYYTQDVNNELFMDLKIKGQGKNDAIQSHLKKVLRGTPVVAPHHRYQVNYN